VTITEPGVYTMDEADYHADPVPGGSLTSSGARKLLASPARFDYDREHPPAPTPAMELGTAAHKLVLGTGPPIVTVEADDWRTKAAKEAAAAAREAGAVPLLTAEHDQVQAMAAALRDHPIAAALFDPEGGDPEQSLFWVDERTGVWMRARLDWLRHTVTGRRLIIGDYKTAASASPEAFAKAVANFGYHQQAPFYCDGAAALGLDPDPGFLFVVQEKTPPYLVAVYELDALATEAGRARNRRAAEMFRDCTEAGVWPGYPGEIGLISLPPWATRTEEYA
jgi:PDDEXK-like domain of unknown function (DUF3799)